MSSTIDQVYEQAVASRLLPGASLIAGDINGNALFSKSLGKASLKAGHNDPFTEKTICSIASMSKLMTSVAVLKAVEQGKLDLDTDARALLPEMGKYGIITGFDDDKNEAILIPDSTPISIRMLLSHTSGHEYDWFNPLLGKWRASRNEEPWTGPTVADKSALPLVRTPGSGFLYGAGHDWSGKAIEVATGIRLEEYMREHLWAPLGIENEISFYPKENPLMRDRMADISTTNEAGDAPASDAPFFDPLFGGTECLGGAGVFASLDGYFQFLSAVFRRDPRLLKPESYDELFRPQLDEKNEQSFNDYMASSPLHTQYLRLSIPHDVRMTWSFAGMVAKASLDGRFEKGTTFWAGVPSIMWFMDHTAGICGAAFCQMLPPMHPAIIALHAKFQAAVYEKAKASPGES